MPRSSSPLAPGLAAILLAGLLTGCVDTLPNLDFRGNSIAGAQVETAPRPQPDANGLITYESYQVVVARRGDTVAQVASRVGLTAAELASFNGRAATDVLRDGEVLAMPRRVATSGSGTDIASIARGAIDEADTAAPGATPQVQQGVEPVRHRVGRGETAYSIARLYGVSVRSIAEWNGLGPDLAVRENQFLLIPIVLEGTGTGIGTAAPGDSIAPPPPSAGEPLPDTIATAPLPPASGGGPTPPAPAPAPAPNPNPNPRPASSGPSMAPSCAPSPRRTKASTSPPRPARQCAQRATARLRRSPRTPTACRSW
jgi:lipoprotein NlpD